MLLYSLLPLMAFAAYSHSTSVGSLNFCDNIPSSEVTCLPVKAPFSGLGAPFFLNLLSGSPFLYTVESPSNNL